MTDLCRLIFWTLVDLMRARATLEAEIWVLRQQINVLRRAAPRRQSFGIFDRLIFVGLYRLFPKACDALAIVKPDTIIRWHRAGFRAYWRWKSRHRGGRPTVPQEIRKLIREISIANPLWGAPRIHGELLKIGIEIGQTSAAKYMVKRREPPSQGWKTFLRNHADGVAAMDLFVVPTISFRLLYGLLIVGHGRRQILWFGVTSHPTAEWIANQITEACGWEQAPRYLIRDRDGAYGEVFIRRLQSMGIRDRPTAPRSPWQNGYAERLIGSIRRECVDHIIVLGERHDTSVSGQRCADLAAGSADRSHHFKSDPWRTSSPLHPNLGFRYTQELLPTRAQRLCPRFWNGASVGRQREGPYRFTRQLEKEEALPRSTDNHVCRPNATCPYSALLTSRMRGAEDSIRLR